VARRASFLRAVPRGEKRMTVFGRGLVVLGITMRTRLSGWVASVNGQKRKSFARVLTCTKLPSDFPQNASRDGKKTWRNRISPRRAKSLSLRKFDDKVSIRKRLANRARSNPSLSVPAFASKNAGARFSVQSAGVRRREKAGALSPRRPVRQGEFTRRRRVEVDRSFPPIVGAGHDVDRVQPRLITAEYFPPASTIPS